MLIIFIIHSLEYINQWSQDYLKEVDRKTFAEEPHLTLELWTNIRGLQGVWVSKLKCYITKYQKFYK